MKHRVLRSALLLILTAALLAPTHASAEKRKKKSDGAIAEAPSDKEVHWLSLDDVQVEMKKQAKPVWFDVYTGWCGWCKVMDKKTYTNPDVIRYINDHFYAVKLDAETKDSIRFVGKMYGFVPEERANHFAVEMLHGQLSYPTSVFMPAGFGQPMAIPGYQDVPTMEKILKYLGEGKYKVMSFPDWEKEFKATWAVTDSGPVAAPGH